MRLTLRTLLAYVDDTLPPAQAREIGTRIAEVPEAAVLMQKLRDVIRRRRISAPNLTGPGSGPDPNIVGDYLESSLAPADVVELEQLCYRSDMHLAEVAACHKILSLVLGDPVEVPQDMRERMYALGRSNKSPLPQQEASPSAAVAAEREQAATAEQSMRSTEALFEDGIPDYLKRGPGSRRWTTGAFVLLLGIVWLALFMPDFHTWKNAPPEQEGTPEELVAQAEPKPDTIPEAPATPAQPAGAASADGQPAKVPAAPAAMEPNAVVKVGDDNTVPLPEPLAVPEPAEMPEPKEMTKPAPAEVAPAVPVVPAAPALPVAFAGGDGVFLHRDASGLPWMATNEPTLLKVGAQYASPVPFSTELQVGNQLVDLRLEPGTLIQRLPGVEGETLALHLDRGRMELMRVVAEGHPRIRVEVGSRVWTIELTEPGTIVGVAVDLPEPTGLPGTGMLRLGGGIQVAAGVAMIALGEEAPIRLAPDTGRLAWPQVGMGVMPDPVLPGFPWLNADQTVVTSAATTYARMFAKEFMMGGSVADNISPVVDNRSAKLAEFAVQTMALTDYLPGMVRGLKADHEEARIAAIVGLRTWLVRDPANEELLRGELGRSFRDADVSPIVRLLWGYSAADAMNTETSAKLVALLGHEEIAVRELAFYHVAQLTGRKYDYRPLDPPARRRAAELRWEDHLKRVGALVAAQN